MPTNPKYFSKIEHLFPEYPESAWLVAVCRKPEFSASRIARAVEDADAHLLNLNVTDLSKGDDDRVTVSLRVNHRNPSSVIRSLERYGYEVHAEDEPGITGSGDSDGEPGPMETLMRYLEI